MKHAEVTTISNTNPLRTFRQVLCCSLFLLISLQYQSLLALDSCTERLSLASDAIVIELLPSLDNAESDTNDLATQRLLDSHLQRQSSQRFTLRQPPLFETRWVIPPSRASPATS
ncbi:hypothetical protein [Neptunomonas concharum]|uniref:Uncharacterized protein n=1 Tax=Neptunomonas concharum TaxID=1031538 RepID=A0A5P1RDI3_9GAMM|nr:hypothetical protein [Neptunomonas concharum]QEQ97709.1 hypothetical protein F0U83_13805 [Neptunomonas concharum]